MGKFAARVGDLTMHPLPGALAPGPGSFNILIEGMPAWRAMPAAAAAAFAAAKVASDAAIVTAEAATVSSAGVAAPAEATLKTATVTAAQSAMSASGADIHLCATFPPLPVHGPGVVVTGSLTVLWNKLPASRMGDTILEAMGPPNMISKAAMKTMIGG